MGKKKSLLIPVGRKSSKEDPAVSRDRQLRAIEAWAAGEPGVELAPFVFERGVSGSKPWQERGLGEAIAACKRGEADGIVLEEQSRLSRQNGLATAEVWNALQNDGAPIRLVLVADGIDTAAGDHELNFSVRAALAREQWKQYARRVDHAKKRAIERGVHISAKCPVGYLRPMVDAAGRELRGQPLELDPETAPAITRAFELRATGATRRAVVELLEELLPGGPRGRGAWTIETVTALLGNRVYLGEARQGRYSTPGAHDALVDQRTFDTVQALNRPEPRAVPHAKAALLAGGIVRCATCEYGMSLQANGRSYACRGHSASGKCSARASISAPALEAFVEAAARERFESARSRIELVAVDVDVAGLHGRLAELREQRLMYEQGDFALQLGPAAATRALQKIDAEVDAIELELREAVGADAFAVDPDATWPEGFEDRAAMIRAGVEAVIVSPRPAGPRLPLEERVELRLRGDGPPTPRPNMARRDASLEAGVVAA